MYDDALLDIQMMAVIVGRAALLILGIVLLPVFIVVFLIGGIVLGLIDGLERWFKYMRRVCGFGDNGDRFAGRIVKSETAP